MVTLCIMPNFVGTTGDKIKALITCLLLDSMYIVPMLMLN